MRAFPRLVRTVRKDFQYAQRKANRAFHFAENRPVYQLLISITVVLIALIYLKTH